MVVPILPIIPSVNTCMSLTTTTTTSSSTVGITKPSSAVPEFNTSQLQAFADVCSTVNCANTISNAVMNSLVSATKIVLDDNIPNTIANIVTSNIEIPKKIPISTIPVAVMKIGSTQFIQNECIELNNPEINENIKENEPLMNVEDDELRDTNEKSSEKMVDVEKIKEGHDIFEEIITEPMECGSSIASQTSPNNMIKALSEDVIMSDNAKGEVRIFLCIFFNTQGCVKLTIHFLSVC